MYRILLVIIFNLAVILPSYFFLDKTEKSRIENVLNTTGESILNTTTISIANINHELRRTSAIFRQNGIFITNDSFRDYLQFDNFQYKNYIQNFFWIAKVPYNETVAFNNFCSNNVYPNFTIKEVNITNNTIVPVTLRNDYWPFVYFDPFISSYVILLGYDVGSNPVGKVFLDVIGNTRNVTATFRVELVQGIYKNPYNYGTLVGLGTTDNNNNTIGGVFAIIQVKRMLYQSLIFQNLQNSDVNIFVFDITNDGVANNRSLNMSLLYKPNVPEYNNIWFENDVAPNFNTKRYIFLFVNRTWVIYFSFTDSYISKFKSSAYVITIISIAAVLFLIDAILLIFNYYVGMARKNIMIETKKKETLNHLIAFFNHEVRNPVNVIKGTLELNLEQLLHFVGLTNESESDLTKLAIDENSKEKKITIPLCDLIPIISDYYTAIGSCNLVEHIINDILVLRTLEENKLKIIEKNVNVQEFVMQFNKSIKQKLNEKPQIVYETRIEEGINSVFIDPMRLTQIMLNYFTNAIKFTDEGKIAFNIYRFNDEIRFEITDTGRGIKEEDKPKLFNRFSQLDAKDFTRHHGFGLGLYICGMLAKRMNSSVGFESKIGEGSKFWFQIKNEEDPTKVNIHINSQQNFSPGEKVANDDIKITFLDPVTRIPNTSISGSFKERTMNSPSFGGGISEIPHITTK